jgi:hypothetical protein
MWRLSVSIWYFCPVLLCLLHTSSGARAQRPVTVSAVADAQGAYQFSAVNHTYSNYVLEIGFRTLDNLKSSHALPFRTEIKPGNTKLFRLTKLNPSIPEKFDYHVNYYKGCMHPRVDTGFTYILPISPGKEAQAYEMQSPGNSRVAGQELKDWYVIRLRMKPGDTIYASRRGTVTEVVDNSGLNDQGAASPGEENFVEIVHADCSFGHYGVLRKGSALVKPGQKVEAGDPIGLVGGDKFGRGSEARISVYYNVPADSTISATTQDMNVYWQYIPLRFTTRRNGKGGLRHGATYTSEWPEAVLTQELSPQELKKWKAARHPH